MAITSSSQTLIELSSEAYENHAQLEPQLDAVETTSYFLGIKRMLRRSIVWFANCVEQFMSGSPRPMVSRSQKAQPRTLSFEFLEVKSMCAAGVLDSSWNGNGRLTLDFGGTDVAASMAIQPDGKVIMAGSSAPNDSVALARTNDQGQLDPSFGNQGRMTFSMAGRSLGAGQVAVQSDGRIVIAGGSCLTGSTNCSLLFARFTTTGQIDTSFGSSGIVTLDYGNTYETFFDMAIQSDGKIVATGYYGASLGSYDFVTVRINSNGSLDDGSANDSTPGDQFGTGGAVKLNIGVSDVAWALALQADGKIVVAGRTGGLFASNSVCVVRLNSNGSLDTNFNGTGILTPDFAGDDGANAVAILPDGSIVVGGNSNRSGSNQFMLMKISAVGQIVSSFGNGGMSEFPVATSIYGITSLVVQPDGKLVGLGTKLNSNSTEDFGLIRSTASGSLDTTFGTGGIVVETWSGNGSQGNDVRLTEEGLILAAGYAVTAPGNVDMAISRYQSGLIPTVRMDIMPSNGLTPTIRINSLGITTITIYGSRIIDAKSIDSSSLRFEGARSIGVSYQDIDQDGRLDAVYKFKTKNLNLLPIYGARLAIADTIDDKKLDPGVSTKQRATLSLSGRTTAGKDFTGSASADIFLSGMALRKFLKSLAGI
ncbi:MAG: hypothetical protein ACKOBW_10205 [Planctomycetota bacterium]